MAKNVYATGHEHAAHRSDDPQERNRAWWEELPMTYEAWESGTRIPQTRDDFDRLNKAYIDGNPWLRQHFHYSAFAGRQVLEIGCGAGSAACFFASAGAHVTAIDLTDQAVAITARNARVHGHENLIVRRMDAERMEFPDASFDYVYSWGVIHHSSAPERIFAELSRVLRPGGGGLVMVYNRASLRYWLKGLFWLLIKGKLLAGENLGSIQRFFTDGFFHKHYTAAELTRLLSSLGVQDFQVSVTHMAKRMIPGLPRSIDEALKRRYGWLLVVRFSKPPK